MSKFFIAFIVAVILSTSGVILYSSRQGSEQDPSDTSTTSSSVSSMKDRSVPLVGSQHDTSEQKSGLTLHLSPSEIEEAIQVEVPLSLTSPNIVGTKNEGLDLLRTPPVTVELQNNDTPIVQYHFERKAPVAKKADLQDRLDGIEVEKQIP